MIPEKYRHIVRKGERIQRYSNPSADKYRLLKIFLLGTVILVVIARILLGPENFVWIILLLPFFLVFTGLIGAIIDSGFLPSSSQSYIITDKRIYVVDESTKGRNYYYHDYRDIYKIEKKKNKIYLYGGLKKDPVGYYKTVKLDIIHTDPKRPFEQSVIRSAWFENSPYQVMNEQFRKLIEQYNFTLSPFKLDRKYNKKLELIGMIEGMEILISIGSIGRLKTVAFAFRCPNEEQNYLLVKKEGKKEKWAKKIGMQDVQTGNPMFDDHFLLQSNNQIFFDYVMTVETQEQLTSVLSNLDGVLRMGETEKMPKDIEEEEKHPALDSFILDEHLTNAPKNNKKERISGFTTPLVYSCKDITTLGYDPEVISDRLIQVFETMLGIALKIQEYNRA